MKMVLFIFNNLYLVDKSGVEIQTERLVGTATVTTQLYSF